MFHPQLADDDVVNGRLDLLPREVVARLRQLQVQLPRWHELRRPAGEGKARLQVTPEGVALAARVLGTLTQRDVPIHRRDHDVIMSRHH